MGFIRGQLPAFAQARVEQDAERERRPDQLQALDEAISGGLNAGLESAIGDYLETERNKKTLGGAAEILKSLPRDYD